MDGNEMYEPRSIDDADGGGTNTDPLLQVADGSGDDPWDETLAKFEAEMRAKHPSMLSAVSRVAGFEHLSKAARFVQPGTSAWSQLNLWVDGDQFASRVAGFHVPVDATLR